VLVQTTDGVVVEPPGRRVDLHIAADPVTMVLMMSGRTGRIRPALLGRAIAWGRHPLRAMRMLDGMRAA
jgi:hypothetical protein